MSTIQYVLFYLTLLSFICRCPSLVELPPVEDNSIMETEAAIRNTINQVFSLLMLNKVEDKIKLQQYGQIHNYFTSVTLRDYNNLREITQLTRVDNKNVDNTTLNFIALINTILNADSFTENEENNVDSLEYITEDAANYLKSYLSQLNYFEETVSNSSRVDVNEEVAKILASINIEDLNIPETQYDDPPKEDSNLLVNNEFWQPIEETRRIYKGKRTRIKTFPFMAVILAFNVFQCAGSIIHSDLVLTAASCLQLAYNNRFYRENPAFLSVRVGSNFHNGGGEIIAILEIFFHPSYDPKSLRHNLAVVRLIRHLKLTTSRVKKIAIDTKAAPLPHNTPGITIIGWGANSASNVVKSGFENRLTYAILDVYGLKDCQEIYSKEYVTLKHFCAGFITKGSGACNRDVGGPGVAAGILRGVVSFGSPQCGTPDAPTVFTKVGYYADWIETIMEQDIPSGRMLTTLRTRHWIWPSSRTTATDFRVTPVPDAALQTDVISPATTSRPIGRQNKKVDMKLFREFLKTMFESNEIDEYLDQFMSEKGIGRQLTTPTTEEFTAVEFVTKNIDVEPETSDYEAEFTTEIVYSTATDKSKTYAHKVSQTKKESDAEKELEKDIIELINNADLREILLESVSTATMPAVTHKADKFSFPAMPITIQKTKKRIKNKVKKGKNLKRKQKNVNKEKKAVRTGQEQMSQEQQKTRTKVPKENEIKLLYLTAEEKDPIIFNKANNGLRTKLEDGISKKNQDNQDLGLYMTEDIYDESVDTNNIVNTDDESDEIVSKQFNFTDLAIADLEQKDIVNEEVFQQRDEVGNVFLGQSQDYTDTDESFSEDERKGMDISFDIPSIPEVLANPAPLHRQIPPPFETQIDFDFRAVGAQNQSEPKKVIVDILNEVMIADDLNGNATKMLPLDSILTAAIPAPVSSQILQTATNNQTLS